MRQALRPLLPGISPLPARLRGIVLLAVTTACASLAEGGTTVRAVGFIPRNDPLMVQALAWVDAMNDRLENEFHVDFIGGPEVFPRQHQLEAVRSRVVEMSFLATSDYQDQLPEASAFTLSRLTPSEERRSGFYDFMVKAHERVNTRYIGRMQHSPFYLYLKAKPATLAELTDRRIRTGFLYHRFLRELDMVPISIAASETYTALERGLIEGFVWPTIGPRRYGWLEDVRYVIDLPFFAAGNIVALMNLDQWNELPASLRERISEITAEYELRMVDYYRDADAQEQQEIAAAGVQRVRFTPAENDRFVAAAYRVEWAQIDRRVPHLAAELKRISGN